MFRSILQKRKQITPKQTKDQPKRSTGQLKQTNVQPKLTKDQPKQTKDQPKPTEKSNFVFVPPEISLYIVGQILAFRCSFFPGNVCPAA
jgi:hypothetical protein